MQRIAPLALAAAFAASAAAQSAARSDAADPGLAPKASAPESAFADYRRYAEPELLPWREANEQVRRLGGHAGHVPTAAPTHKTPPGGPPAAQPISGGGR